jgi:hypothetical protein
MKDSRQAEVTVSWPGRDQEEIQAVPLTARKEVKVPRLVTPLTNPNFIPFVQSSEAWLPVIRFPSLFDPTPNPNENMPVQKRSINIGSVLGTLAPQSSETFPPPPPPGFSQGESVMKKRKREEERDDEVGEQQALPLTEPLKTKSPSKKEKSKSGQALQKAANNVSHKWKHRNNKPKIPWSCAFSVEGRPIDEDDSVVKGNEVRGGQVADVIRKALLLPRDMKIWQ